MTLVVQLAGGGGAEDLPWPFSKIGKKSTDFGKNPLVVCDMAQISHLKGCFKSV